MFWKRLPPWHLAPHIISKVLHVFKSNITEIWWKYYQEDDPEARTSELFLPFFLCCQTSSYLSKHCDLVSCSATSHPVLILSVWVILVSWRSLAVVKRVEGERECKRVRERERLLVRKAITCSLKEQMESFCASFPPFPRPSAYLNDMSSPNIQLLSWEFPPCSPLCWALSMWVPEGVCVFTSLLCMSYQSVCVCVCCKTFALVWCSY